MRGDFAHQGGQRMVSQLVDRTPNRVWRRGAAGVRLARVDGKFQMKMGEPMPHDAKRGTASTNGDGRVTPRIISFRG